MSLINGFDYKVNSYSKSNKEYQSSKSWGSCMEESIDLLYNDWENDGVGTLACWVSGWYCAVGAAIYCAF
jgi:hypothetical protein